MNFLSHPHKPLEVHIKGVLKNTHNNTNLKIVEVAVLFHDLGKINDNFQKKLNQENNEKHLGYSEHSYLSAYTFLCFLEQNRCFISKYLNSDAIKIKQIIAIIAKHHSDLPDFEGILNNEVLKRLEVFVKSKPYLPISEFCEKKLLIEHQKFEIQWNEKLLEKLPKFLQRDFDTWKNDALCYFMDTQYAFASLIEADKRDAGNNDIYVFKEKIEKANKNLAQQLIAKFVFYDNSPLPSELNQLRTAIRKEASENVEKGVKNGIRIFTLTAPTGGGKTFSLLSIAAKIQELKGNLGIIYALPFLSITEQVREILDDLNIDCLPVTSKSQNKQLEEAQKIYEDDPTEENLQKLIRQSFSENTFDHPFILTTFVQFFETLVSNKNSTLLKLPNFCNRIFLLDEVQALPPRLYIFFTALLHFFCQKHNSFAVLSTGTMPKFELPNKQYTEDFSLTNPKLLFKDYTANSKHDVFELIQPEKYFKSEVFNRYKINLIGNDEYSLNELAVHISKQKFSCLVILNTISDTKLLYELIKESENAILLNTHFTPLDRLKKIDRAKEYLCRSQKVVLVSTQLIEAGVDIDFPIVYRDLCPLPSLIQSAGRCNRNKKIKCGQVYFFSLVNEEGKASSKLIYRNEAADFLKFSKAEITHGVEENQLYDIQSRFFESIKDNLSIGEFTYYVDKYGNERKYNFIECINSAAFEKVGKFQLIIESNFGNQYQYYVRENEEDHLYEQLIVEMEQSLKAKSYEEKMPHKIKMENLLKTMSSRLITVRIKDSETPPAYYNLEEYFSVRVLLDLSKYTEENGLNISNDNCII